MKYASLLLFFSLNIPAMRSEQILERKQNRTIDCCQLASNVAGITKCCFLFVPYKAAEYTVAAGVKPFEVINDYLKNKKND